jgi:outer membrane protein assembly factor BamB
MLRDVGVHRRAAAATIAVGLVFVCTSTVRALDDDVPKRQPVLAWEVPVACDSDQAIVDAGGSGRHCVLAVADNAVYVHEHAGSVGRDGPFRLSAHDVATGAVRWSHDVGESFEINLTDEAVVLSDKAHIEVYDAETGDLRFTREGGLVKHNEYGVLVMEAGTQAITAIDAANGEELWTMPGAVGAMCRDFVAVVPSAGGPAAPFALVDHRTGRIRWESTMSYDPASSHMACSGAPWMYVTNSDRLYELDSFDGWTTWETAVPGVVGVDLYREVALVRTGADGALTTAVRREDGVVLWEAPTNTLGASLSWVGRLREDETGLFTLHPLTGQIVQRVDFTGSGAPQFEVVGVSDTRVVVATGSIVTAYGMNDLGVAWQLDVGAALDDVGVTDGYLVVRYGDVLRGYTAAPREGG